MSGKKKNKRSDKSTNKNAKKDFLIPLITGVIAAGLIITLALISAFGGKEDVNTSSGNNTSSKTEEKTDGVTSSEQEDKKMESIKVLVEMEDGGEFTLALYPEFAPKTVENFVKLVNEGFYEGVGFHRVVEGFMAQGGDPEGTGMGGSDETIPGEFASNGFSDNTLSHTRGVISMARSQNPNSASSQFFICYDNASFLDGDYAAFGEVIDGMETVDEFLDVERTYNSMGELASPAEPIVMKSVTIIEE